MTAAAKVGKTASDADDAVQTQVPLSQRNLVHGSLCPSSASKSHGVPSGDSGRRQAPGMAPVTFSGPHGISSAQQGGQRQLLLYVRGDSPSQTMRFLQVPLSQVMVG